MSTDTRVLVIGYGNPGRCDDGLGMALAERIEALQIPGVAVLTRYQLNVEDADDVAKHQVVVFLDACLCAPPPYFFRELEARAGTLEFTTHSLAPEGVLGLAHDVFGAPTKGYAVAVRGYDFHGVTEEISDDAKVNLEEALAFLAEALQPGGDLHPMEVGV
jgi:hydrogenase maturation protease